MVSTASLHCRDSPPAIPLCTARLLVTILSSPRCVTFPPHVSVSVSSFPRPYFFSSPPPLPCAAPSPVPASPFWLCEATPSPPTLLVLVLLLLLLLLPLTAAVLMAELGSLLSPKPTTPSTKSEACLVFASLLALTSVGDRGGLWRATRKKGVFGVGGEVGVVGRRRIWLRGVDGWLFMVARK